jgi:hypothetical protein
MAALVGIPGSIAGIVYLLGIYTSLKFAWLVPFAPYIYSSIVFALLMLLVALVMDYIAVRRAAFVKPVNPQSLIEAEKQERIAEVTLKQRTVQLANELFELLKKQGLEPPDPLSLTLSQRGSEEKQQRLMTAYFDWQTHLYFNYMAYFKDRVVKLDYELAASRIITRLEDEEINPPRAKGQVDIKRIAETLLLEANRMSD